MSKYFYKGTDISQLVVSGNETRTDFIGFPAYKNTSGFFGSDRPLPFGLIKSDQDISELMDANYVDITSGSAYYNIPDGYDSVRIILIGGSGGSGGGGGCGWNSLSSVSAPSIARTTAGDGTNSGKGSFIFTNTIKNLAGKSIYYSVGSGGAKGNAGGDKSKSNVGPGGKGNNGSKGNESRVQININGTWTDIYANGGYGGGGGDAGGPSAQGGDSPEAGPNFANTYTGLSDYTPTAYLPNVGPGAMSANPIIAKSVNPIGYLNHYGLPSYKGLASDWRVDSGNGNDGNPGKIRIYLLKE